jgi:hypothetical protein
MKSKTIVAIQAAICIAIISKVKYTEIDWTAYMQQAELFLEGERDYSKLIGGTVNSLLLLGTCKFNIMSACLSSIPYILSIT